MYSSEPDLYILLGVRALASLIGIVCIAFGSWKTDREWDEEGSAAYEQAGASYVEQDDEGKPSEGPFGSFRWPWQGPHEEKERKQPVMMTPEKVAKVQREVKLSISLPTLFGWMLLAFSYLLDRRTWFGFNGGALCLVTMILTAVLAASHVVWFRQAVMDRQVSDEHYALAFVLGAMMILLGILTACLNPNAPWWMAPLGAICIASSSVVLWFARRMGNSFDKVGHPNVRPVVFNFGGPLLAFGWFWFWIGMNAVYAQPDHFYAPFYLGARTAMAFCGAVAIVITLWMVGYALDEMPEYEDYKSGPGFGVAGIFFGSVWEIKLGITASWLFMGGAVFLPLMISFWPYVLFGLMALEGVAQGILYEQALRSCEPDSVQNWAIYSAVLLVAIAVFVSFHGFTAIVLSAMGVAIIMMGHYVLHNDRKRGKIWTTTGTEYAGVVFSYGALLIPTGMLIFAWALSLR